MVKLLKLKYRHKIAAVIFMFTLLPVLVMGSFLFGRLWNSKVEELLSKNRIQLTDAVNDIDDLLEACTDKISYVKNNYYIMNFFETNTDNNLVGIMSFFDYLQSMMSAIKSSNSGTEIVIYSLDAGITYDSEYIRSLDRFKSELTENERNLLDEILKSSEDEWIWKFRNIKSSYFNTKNENNYICVYKKIFSLNRTIAFIEARIPFGEITGLLKYDIPEGGFIICDILNSSKTAVIKEGKIDSEAGVPSADIHYPNDLQKKFFVLNADFKTNTGKVSVLIPRTFVMQGLKWYLITILIFFLIIIVILFSAVEVASFYLTKKLSVLLQKMNTDVESLINNDDLDIYKADDEIGKIGKMFYELISRIKGYYKKLSDYETEMKALESQLLQERINPHFLYNTLSTIKWLVGDSKIQNVIESLVKYYRIALSKGKSIIMISQEIDMIKEYLELQKFAYGLDFDYVMDIDEEAEVYLILKHLLQPIVENAVLHGVNGMETGGMIKISCRLQGGSILFTIADNGPGMDEPTTARVANGASDQLYRGYGVKNVLERIKLFYGDDYGIDIKSSKNLGTTVNIRIPCTTDRQLEHR